MNGGGYQQQHDGETTPTSSISAAAAANFSPTSYYFSSLFGQGPAFVAQPQPGATVRPTGQYLIGEF